MPMSAPLSIKLARLNGLGPTSTTPPEREEANGSSTASTSEKLLRQLRKKLKESEKLVARRAAGEPLSAPEQEKLGKMAGWCSSLLNYLLYLCFPLCRHSQTAQYNTIIAHARMVIRYVAVFASEVCQSLKANLRSRPSKICGYYTFCPICAGKGKRPSLKMH